MKRYKIGLIAGTYDVFRLRHLSLLSKAKEQCDHLLVGIYTDEAIVNQTGSRPLIPFQERRQIVESTRYADQVIPLYDDDFTALKNQYPFDVIIGDDGQEAPLSPTITS